MFLNQYFRDILYTGECHVANGIHLLKLRQLLKSLKLDWDVEIDFDELKNSSSYNEASAKAGNKPIVKYHAQSASSDKHCKADECDDEDLWALPPIFYEHSEKTVLTTVGNLKSTVKCSHGCSNNCAVFIEKWKTEEIDDLKRKFSSLNNVQIQHKLLKQLEFQRSAGMPTCGYYFNGILLCVNQMHELSTVSKYMIRKVLRNFARGHKRFIHGNSSKVYNRRATTNFCTWLKLYSEKYGQDGPTDVVTVLPSYMNKAELYKVYLKEAVPPLLKRSSFYKLFKSKFGPRRIDKSLKWIRISKDSTHSKCDVCTALNQFIRGAKNAAELAYAKSLKLQHTDKYSKARVAVNEFIQRSITSPREVVAFLIDTMDNSKSLIPRVREKTKQLSGMFRLPCKITGCISRSSLYESSEKNVFYIQHGLYNLFSLHPSLRTKISHCLFSIVYISDV